MAITTLSSREFNQDASRAKKAAKRGPVFITNQQENILDLLAMPDAAEVEFEPPRLSGNLHRPADLG
jgi:hypothetical protein